MFSHKRSVKLGLSCNGIFFGIQCCPSEIFAIKTLMFSFSEELCDTVND